MSRQPTLASPSFDGSGIHERRALADLPCAKTRARYSGPTHGPLTESQFSGRAARAATTKVFTLNDEGTFIEHRGAPVMGIGASFSRPPGWRIKRRGTTLNLFVLTC